MAINLSDNIKISGPLPVDSRYFNNLVPYTSTGQTNSVIVSGERHIGLTVNINNLEYWYASGTTDNDLVIKTMGGAGTITGAGNGLSVSGGTTIVLGGTLTGATFTGGILGYAGDYSSGFTIHSIVDAGYVTGQTANLQADIDYISGITAQNVLDIDYISGITAQNVLDIDYISGITSQNILDIQYISGITDSNINRLNIIESDYLTGATNGVCKYDDHNVCLGGALTSPIIFTGSDANHLCYAGDYSGGYTPRSIPDVNYVDNIASGLLAKGAVWVATTGATDFVYPQSGLTIIDGVQTTHTMRVLVKDPANSIYNGIWVVNSGGTWTRAGDFDGTPTGETVSGSYMWVLSGNTYKDTSWVLNTSDPIIVNDPPLSGDTPLNFVLYNHVQDVQAGTGITVTTVTGTHYVSLSPATQATLAATITGVTNVGGGESIYSGTCGHNLVLNTIVGSGNTSISKIGDEIIIFTSGATGGGLYVGESPTVCTVGGVPIGYTLTGRTLSCIIQDIFVPELFGSITPPSTSIGLTCSGIKEIGIVLSQTVSGTFSRGSISPQYCSASPFRSGCANAYCFTGTGMPSGWQTCVLTPGTYTNPSYTVVSGVQTWGVCTRFDSGSTAMGSKGTPYGTPPALLSGSTSLITNTITGILPWFWGVTASGTVTASMITGGTPTVAVVGASTPITFNATTQYLWFAAPTGTYTTKTKWWVCAANAGNIGGTGELWKQQGTISVTCGSKWAGCSFDVYVTCGITTTASGIPMCLYY